MNTLDTIINRHSYRGIYQNTPVPRDHLEKILEAGCAAPSGCNKQTTSFIAVDDPQVLAKLHHVIDPPLGVSAPAMICVMTQKIIAYQDRTFYIHDYSAALENMLLTITALGYASCWVEGHVTNEKRIGEKMANILDVTEDYQLIAYLPVGIPAEEVRGPRKKPLSERAWFNGFGK